MLSGKLISFIEGNADTLIEKLIKELRSNEKTSSYKNFSNTQLVDRTKNVYKHLSSWLGDKTEDEIKKLYTDLGKERKSEGVPLSQVVAALTITRNNLVRYIQNEIPCTSSLEIYQQMEFTSYITMFFDKAIHNTAIGFEQAE